MAVSVILKKSFGKSEMRIRLPSEDRKRIERHALEAFPQECCGFLFGTRTVDGWLLKEVRPSKNVSATPRTGFQLDGREQVAAMKYADEMNLETIGYYHSHPNGRRGPSPTDFVLWGGDPRFLSVDDRSKLPEELMNTDVPRLPDHSMQIIIAVEKGVVTDTSAWQLRRDLSGLDQINLEFFH
jgi:proteasome lid subunit RPN8/RPN11